MSHPTCSPKDREMKGSIMVGTGPHVADPGAMGGGHDTRGRGGGKHTGDLRLVPLSPPMAGAGDKRWGRLG